MGLLIDGIWQDQWYDTKNTGGRFVRSTSQFRNFINANDKSEFKAEPGRYHLYVSYACPWAHRTLIFRALKGLESIISLSVVHWLMRENGWTFTPAAGVIPDSINQAEYLHQIYTKANPNYSGRVTVPVLWDKHTQTIVNNESAEIIRMFNSAFDQVGALPGDYYPQELREEIDALNERIYNTVNNGVYKAGFATSQEAYEEAVNLLFVILDELEVRLSTNRYLMGEKLTEADWRLFTTLVRFDLVYVGHFKCNKKRIVDYPNLWGYIRELYQIPQVAETVNFTHIKNHYYQSHITINPTQIVPAGPDIDFTQPHQRDLISGV
jgi:putative glutathione S-transferase